MMKRRLHYFSAALDIVPEWLSPHSIGDFFTICEERAAFVSHRRSCLSLTNAIAISESLKPFVLSRSLQSFL
jgi:hypothetical protein